MPRRRNEEEEEYGGGGKFSRKRPALELSDGEEEEIDKDEDSDDGRRGGRCAKKRSASHFFDLEVDVASDEDDEDEEEGEDDFIVDGGVDIPYEEDSRRIDRRPLLPYEDEKEDFEALERSIQARYGSRSSHAEYDEETADIGQQALLPSVRDPKLWMVKCDVGHEREIAVCLMQKCINKGSKLQIKSAIALDHLKNYIYIEADKECHVKEACKDMRYIHTGSKILFVPIKEMTNVLSVESKAIDLSRDTWVRMKIGTYKGDLAKVVDVDNVRHRVTVKLIPRIDLQALANKLEGREVPKKNMVTPQRYMKVDEAREMNIRVERKRDQMTGDYFDNINGMMFKDGFLYKTVSMKSISTQNIHPSFDEIEKFRQPGENGDGDMASLSTLFANRKKGRFVKGDRVIIAKGDLKNLKGLVEKVEEDIVHIIPNAKGLPKTLAVNERDLSKYFEPGNHVKVVSGTTEGATGMVLTVEGHLLNIVTDSTKEVLRVFSDDVVESMVDGGSRSNVDTKGHHSLSRFSQLKTPPHIPQSQVQFSRGVPRTHFGGGRGKDNALVGTCIKIRVGNFKGYKGRVVGVKGNSVRVELQSQMTTITVDRKDISDNMIALTPYRDEPRYGAGSETPMHPSQTPLRYGVGSETPMHPSQTPLCMTPMRDPKATPSPPRFLSLTA